MCTAITLQSTQNENFFGRTMDFSYPIEPGLYIMPKNYEWDSIVTMEKFRNDYSFIGIGQETDGMLGFFDGVNEKGFAAAVLYFEGYANYDLPIKNKKPIASLDFLHYMLGRCSSVDDLKILLEDVSIIGIVDPVTEKAAPLHWIASDRSGNSVVIEQTKEGLEVIDNPIGVMANSPDFRWQMTNLRNYLNLSTTQKKEATWGNISLTPFSQGAGTNELPGGFSTPDRFVRTAFLKTHSTVPQTRSEAVMSCFQIMNSVFIPKGIVVTDRETIDYTKYIAFVNTNTCEYYLKTYENSQLIIARLWDYPIHGEQPIFLGSIVHPLDLEG